MPRYFLTALLLLLCVLAKSFGAEKPLSKEDIRPMMQEMLGYHVEFKEFSSLIAKRSFKLYLEQFDSEKSYLLADEANKFLEPSEKSADKAVDGYYNDDFSYYTNLNNLIVKAINRSRAIREEIERELILNFEEPKAAFGESYFTHASSQDQLKERIRKKLVRFLYSEKKEGGNKQWTTERRAKIFAFLERRVRRFEEGYLPGNREEHNFSTHVLKALAKSLDAHTSFFSPDEAFEMRTSLEKQFEGVGVVLKEEVEGVMILGLVKGGPAERNGQILPGDMLVEIDGKSVVGDPYETVLDKMKGHGSKEIVLGVKRFENAGRELLLRVSLRREKIVMQADRLSAVAEPFGDGLIAKLTLPSFYDSDEGTSCEKDMREALKRFKASGKIRGMILDMRENLGGFLNQAVKVAGLFISSGVIVISKYAHGELQYLRDIDGRVFYTGPLIVLTSKASASAAEIVAQALQDYGAAVVVGDERTYGKGSIQYQNVTERGATAFFKVTVGKYYTVSGRSTQIEGVKADIVVPTEYSVYNIGERFLEYPLKNDRLPSAYVEPVTEADKKKEHWWQRRALPQIQKKQSLWDQLCPLLKANSSYRLEHNKDFQLFLKSLKAETTLKKSENWGSEDLQMREAVNILKDMIIQQAPALK